MTYPVEFTAATTTFACTHSFVGNSHDVCLKQDEGSALLSKLLKAIFFARPELQRFAPFGAFDDGKCTAAAHVAPRACK